MNHTTRNTTVRNLFGKSAFLLMSILFATAAHASCPNAWTCDATKFTCEFEYAGSDKTLTNPFSK